MRRLALGISRRSISRTLTGSTLAVLLASCMSAPTSEPAQTAMAPAKPDSAAAPSADDDSLGMTRTTFAAPPRGRAAPPQLAGLTASEVTQVLGVPGLQRHEPSAEVWQYQSATCVLFLFLYQDPARDTAATQASTEPRADRREWRVTYAEALMRVDGRRVPAQECLNGLIDRRPLALGLN